MDAVGVQEQEECIQEQEHGQREQASSLPDDHRERSQSSGREFVFNEQNFSNKEGTLLSSTKCKFPFLVILCWF